jgi:NADH dehydrogenase
MQAFALEFMPVKMLTRDNWLTLKTDATCACPFPAEFGFAPMPLEIQAPDSLLVASEHPRGFLGDGNA